jgi:colicin import membrane protein
MDAEAAERAASAAAAAEAAAEAEAAALANPGFKLSGQSHLERTFARLELQREAEEKEEEDRKTRMAYFRQLLAAEKEEADDDDDDDDEDVEGATSKAASDDERDVAATATTAKDDEDQDEDVDAAAADGKNEESFEEGEKSEVVTDGAAPAPAPPSALDAQLQRWEAEHKRRVEAAKSATEAAAASFAAGRVIQPNTVVTAEQEAAAKAAVGAVHVEASCHTAYKRRLISTVENL